MAMTVDWPNKTISVPQADLTLISGTLYEMDTETYFRASLMALMDDDQGMAWPTPMQHNTAVTVAGITYSRVIEIINGYKVQFTPDSQWTVRLSGSNNNIFDVENGILVQNQVQVIPTNSAGLQVVSIGSGLSVSQATWLQEIWKILGLDSGDPVTASTTQVKTDSEDIVQVLTGNGVDTSTRTRQ